MTKEMFYGKTSLGIIGEQTNFKLINDYTHEHLSVGDVIAFEKYDLLYVRPVTSTTFDKYGVWGFGSNNFDFNKIIKVLPYSMLTEEIYKKIIEDNKEKRKLYSIKEVKEKEMSLKEIEAELGYKVKLRSE